MNILITGAGGQLGRDCSALLSDRYRLTACTSDELDITDPRKIEAVFHESRPEVVINCAAFTAVDRCEEEEERCRAVNGSGPGLLAAQCADSGCRLIHISTDYVFDGNLAIPKSYREDDPVGPLSAYGRSKLEGEREIAGKLDNYLIIRTAWLFGMGGPNFLKTMLRLAVNNPKQTIRVVNDQFGSLTWTKTLAGQIKQLLETDIRGIIHATSEGYSSWYEGAVHFLNMMQVPFSLEPCTTREYPTPAHRPHNSILENHRLTVAGMNRMHSWQEDVECFARENREQLLAEAHGSIRKE